MGLCFAGEFRIWCLNEFRKIYQRSVQSTLGYKRTMVVGELVGTRLVETCSPGYSTHELPRSSKPGVAYLSRGYRYLICSELRAQRLHFVHF